MPEKKQEISSVSHIYLFGEINYKSAQPIVEKIDATNAELKDSSILLTVCSGGGHFYPSFAIYDSIVNSKLPVDVLINGWCGSCAVMILQAARKRLCTINSTIMVHPSSYIMPSTTTHQEVMAQSHQYDIGHRKFMELSSKRSGIDVLEFEKLCKQEMRVYLSPQEALKFGPNGLIDEIFEK